MSLFQAVASVFYSSAAFLFAVPQVVFFKGSVGKWKYREDGKRPFLRPPAAEHEMWGLNVSWDLLASTFMNRPAGQAEEGSQEV